VHTLGGAKRHNLPKPGSDEIVTVPLLSYDIKKWPFEQILGRAWRFNPPTFVS